MTERNASAPLFGWRFQIDAAIWITFDWIRRISQIRVEGKDEDIEFELTDETCAYAQAKSTQKPERNANRKTNLKKALQSLDEAVSGQAKKSIAIYVSNYEDPVSLINPYFADSTVIDLSTLTDKIQSEVGSLLDKYAMKSLNVSNLRVLRLKYPSCEYGSDMVTRKIRNFLSTVDLDLSSRARDIYNEVLEIFFENGTNIKLHVTVPKKLLGSLVLIHRTEMVTPQSVIDHYGLDENEVKQAVNYLESHIDRKVEQFTFATKVLSSYAKYRSISGKTSTDMIDFLDHPLAKDLSDDAFCKKYSELNEHEVNALFFLIYRVISTHETSRKIRQEANIL